MGKTIRRWPPVCILIALINLMIGRLRLSRSCPADVPVIGAGDGFVPFRKIRRAGGNEFEPDGAFSVTFRFARLSDQTNRILSFVPMLAIAGQPGFVSKTYAANSDTGYWRGAYQWVSRDHRDRYRNSLVYRAMKRRALPGTVRETLGQPGSLYVTEQSDIG